MPRRKNISGLPVMKTACLTCPFEGERPIDLQPGQRENYAARCITLKSQHLCHSADNKAICRGGRNLVLRSLFAMGHITEPTDEAFDAASRFYLGSNSNEKNTQSDTGSRRHQPSGPGHHQQITRANNGSVATKKGRSGRNKR